MAENKSRAISIGTGMKGFDLADYNTAVVGGPDAYFDYKCMSAFISLMATDQNVAIIEDWSKSKLELGIYPLNARQVLPVQGYMAFNIGTDLSANDIAVDTTNTVTFGTTVANAYYIVSVYATEAFYLDSSAEFTAVNNLDATNETTGLSAGTHTLIVKAADTSMQIVFKAIDDGNAPSGLVVNAYTITAWTQNQCKAVK